MITETRKVVGLAMMIVAMGVTATELTRGEAHADPALVAGGAAGYAGQRVDAAFQIVADMPATPAFGFPLAQKGDLLPIGCAGPFRPEVAAECMDTAYEVEAEQPATVTETRVGDSTSILKRIYSFTVAEF